MVKMVITFIIYAIFAISFKKNYGVKYSYYSLIILIIRAEVRLLDFENTKSGMKGFKWNNLLVQ